MLDATPELLAQLKQSYVTRLLVSSWRGDTLLADKVPVSAGTLEIDRSLAVPEHLTLTVPYHENGTIWSPTTNDHPLAAYGQLLSVQQAIIVGGDEEILQLGWFLITDASTLGSTVTVNCEGLLKLIEEARFVAPFEPTGTISDTISALVEPALTVVFSGTPTDRSVPVGLHWDEDRLGALREVLDAWPAEAEVTPDGYLSITSTVDPTTVTPVWNITDDNESGTVIHWQGDTSRDDLFNVVVARGEDANSNQVQGTAYDLDQQSSSYYGGPFNPLPVPFLFYSPLLTTVSACTKAANTILARKRRGRSRTLEVTMIPNPLLRPGDVVSVTSTEEDVSALRATVEVISMPLNPGGGEMRLTLSVVQDA